MYYTRACWSLCDDDNDNDDGVNDDDNDDDDNNDNNYDGTTDDDDDLTWEPVDPSGKCSAVIVLVAFLVLVINYSYCDHQSYCDDRWYRDKDKMMIIHLVGVIMIHFMIHVYCAQCIKIYPHSLYRQ